MNISLILVTIPALISLGASIYGMYKLFQKKKPLYFQLLVCAAACFALEELYSTVGIWCNIYNSSINLGMIGVFGCNFFLFSANYGQLDSIVDDGNSINIKAKTIAWLGPIILGLAIIAIVTIFIKQSIFAAIFGVIILAPSCPASYFNIKHLVMPVDDFGFLKATKACNVYALVFYICDIVYAYCIIANAFILQNIVALVMSILILLLVLSSVKGAKQWAI